MISRRSFVAGSAASFVACKRSATDARGRTRLRFWYALGGKSRETLLELVRRFHAAQDEVVVEPVYQGDYFESLAKLRTSIAAKSAPGLSHVVAEVLPYLARANVLEPLDGYPGMREIDFVPQLAQSGAFQNGEKQPLYGVPLNRSTPLMYCNGRIFDEARLSPPKTWEELREIAQKLTLPDGKRWGHEVPIAWWFWVALVGQGGARLFDDQGRFTVTETCVRALRFWQDMVHRDRVMRPPPGRDYDAWNVVNQDFLSGTAACIWTSTAYIRHLETNASFPVVAAPLPADVTSSVPTGGTFLVVVREAPEAEKVAAAKFLRFMCEPEQASFLSTKTGYLPVTKSAADKMRADGFFEAHPNDQVAQDQLPSVTPWPWEPQLFRIERDIIDPRLEGAVLLDKDPRAVLEEIKGLAARPG